MNNVIDFEPIKHNKKKIITRAAMENGHTAGDDPSRKEKNKEKANQRVEKFIASSSKQYLRLNKLIKKGGDYSEKDMGLMLKTMLKMTLRMLPIAQQTYVQWPSSLNAAAYNHLVSQAREITNDLRSVTDLNAQFGLIQESVLDTLKLIMMNLVSHIKPLHKQIEDINPKAAKKIRTALKTMLAEHASYSDQAIKSLEKHLEKLLTSS